jgi:hypothetical protein
MRISSSSYTLEAELEQVIAKFGGDVVQAVQALKETKPERSEQLKTHLRDLLVAFAEYRTFCDQTTSGKYAFERPERQVKDIAQQLFPGLLDSVVGSGSGSAINDKIVVSLPTNGSIERFDLGPHCVPRLFNGLWQLSSPAWGSGSSEDQERALAQLVETGLIAADMADHYVSDCANVVHSRRY